MSAGAAPRLPHEAERIAALHAHHLLDGDAEGAFDDVTLLASTICGTPISLVTFVDGDRTWAKSARGLAVTSAPRNESFCAHVVATRELLVVGDLARDARFAASPAVTGGPRLRFYAGAPVITAEGHVLGALCVIDRKPRELTTAQTDALLALARQTAGVLALRSTNLDLRREAEARARAEQLVRESEARFRRLAAASTDGVAIIENGAVIEANAILAQLLGYTEGEVLGLGVAELFPPDQRAIVAARVRDNVEGRYVTTVVRRDGTTLPVEMNARRLEFHGRELRVTSVRDLTERLAAEQAKAEFVSTVSHELRTPLTSIRGSLGLIEAGAVGPLSERGAQLVRIARENADRLIRLINDILDLEKSEAGRMELRMTAVDAEALVRDAIDGVVGLADQHAVRLCAETDGAEPVAGDRDRLLQVLTNLLSNAIKYSPADGVVTVRVTAGAPGQVRFTVADRGTGIQPDDVHRLFRRFSQLDASDSRQRGGTGLGLAISRSIVEQHGGRIGVGSVPAGGSAFWFELAAAAVAPAVGAPAPAPGRDAAGAATPRTR